MPVAHLPDGQSGGGMAGKPAADADCCAENSETLQELDQTGLTLNVEAIFKFQFSRVTDGVTRAVRAM